MLRSRPWGDDRRPARGIRPACERGSAVADFCLVMVLLVPLVLGIVQVALTLHVRNTITAAAADGARAASRDGASLEVGADRARTQIRTALSPRYAEDVRARHTRLDGQDLVVVEVRTTVPALGVFGSTVTLEAVGRAVAETGTGT